MTKLPYFGVLLNSGGMDSYLLWYLFLRPLKRRLLNLYVDIGQSYADKEREALAAINAAFDDQFMYMTMTGPNLAKQFEDESGIIPNRNGLMIYCAAMFAEEIYLGVIADEINGDKSEGFMMSMEATLNISNRKQYWRERDAHYRIETPARKYTKTELLAEYIGGNGPMDVLNKTISCYSDIYPDGSPCNNCASCFKRMIAYVNNGLGWPEGGIVRLLEFARQQKIDVKCTDGTYPIRRANEVVQGLSRAKQLVEHW